MSRNSWSVTSSNSNSLFHNWPFVETPSGVLRQSPRISNSLTEGYDFFQPPSSAFPRAHLLLSPFSRRRRSINFLRTRFVEWRIVLAETGAGKGEWEARARGWIWREQEEEEKSRRRRRYGWLDDGHAERSVHFGDYVSPLRPSLTSEHD